MFVRVQHFKFDLGGVEMKKRVLIILAFALLITLCSCSNQKSIDDVIEKISNIGTVTLDSESKIKEAEDAYAALKDNDKKQVTNYDVLTLSRLQFDVIYKFENEFRVLGTGKFIEDTYKKNTKDPIIANIYFYSTALKEYERYKELNSKSYLETAKEFAAKIDPNYDGVYSEEMHKLVDELIPKKQQSADHSQASSSEDKYNSLTNKEKKAIGDYIQSRYDYYDKLNGGYSGDKYSDTIMSEAASKYGLTVSQIKVIWMNYYSY